MPEQEISIRAYAETLNTSHTAVNKAITAGKIVKGFNKKTKKIIPSIADKEYGDAARVNKPKPGVSKELVIERQKTQDGKAPKAKLNDADLEALMNLSPGEIHIHAGLSFAEANRLGEIISAQKDKMNLLEQEGKLVRKEKVDQQLYDFAYQLKKALLNIPQRVIANVRAATSEVEAIGVIELELNDVLKTYANMTSLEAAGNQNGNHTSFQ